MNRRFPTLGSFRRARFQRLETGNSKFELRSPKQIRNPKRGETCKPACGFRLFGHSDFRRLFRISCFGFRAFTLPPIGTYFRENSRRNFFGRRRFAQRKRSLREKLAIFAHPRGPGELRENRPRFRARIFATARTQPDPNPNVKQSFLAGSRTADTNGRNHR